MQTRRTMDDPTVRRRIRKTYQASMSEIVRNYPRYDPYFGFDWAVIFTPIERNVWGEIRDLRLPFYPQFPVGPYFIDFADPVKKLGIEVDGRRYHEDLEGDWRREQALEQQGWTIIRILGRHTYQEPAKHDLTYVEEKLDPQDPDEQYSWVVMDSATAVLLFVQRYYYADLRH
jgi:very-short-patch-repair endonuclease